VVLKLGGLLAGELAPAGREPVGELALVGREPAGTEEIGIPSKLPEIYLTGNIFSDRLS